MLSSLREQIKHQRGVTTLGYMGFGVEVPCDELEALIEVAEAARGYSQSTVTVYEVLTVQWLAKLRHALARLESADNGDCPR